MLLLNIILENVFGFVGRHEIDLPRGLVVIAGPNGSGKSSFLAALAFAFSGQNGETTSHIPCQVVPGQTAQISVTYINPAPTVADPNKYMKVNHKLKDGSEFVGVLMRQTVSFRPLGEARYRIAPSAEVNRGGTWSQDNAAQVIGCVSIIGPHDRYSIGNQESPSANTPVSALVRKHAKSLNLELTQGNEFKMREVCELVEPQLTSLLNVVLPDFEIAVHPSDKDRFATCLRHKKTRRYLQSVAASSGTGRSLELLFASEGLGLRSGAMNRTTVIGIDEFETGLHPFAARLLVDRLRNAAHDRTIILTTHSPVVLRAVPLRSLLIAQLTEEGQTTGASQSIQPATGAGAVALDAQFGFISGPSDLGIIPTLLVEGYGDQVILERWAPELANGTGKPQQVRYFFGEGDTSWRFSKFLARKGVRHGCLFDNDTAGQRMCALVASPNGSQVPARVLPWAGTIEDLFPYDALLKLMVQLTQADPSATLLEKTAQALGGAARGFGALREAADNLKLAFSKADLATLLVSTAAQPLPDRLDQLKVAMQGIWPQPDN